MDEQGKPKNGSKVASPQPPPPEIPKPLDTSKAEPATATQLQEVQKEMTAFEKSTLRWAKVAFVMSAVAALFVCLQWCVMKGQLRQMERQNTLVQEQLRGTQAAVVEFNGPTGIQFVGTRFGISFQLKNSGQVFARPIDGVIHAYLWNVKERRSIKTLTTDPCIFHIPAIRTGDAGHVFPQCWFEGLEDNDLGPILNLENTISIQGTITYNDGFEQVIPVPVCFRWIPRIQTSRGMQGDNTGLIDCDNFYRIREIIDNDKQGKQYYNNMRGPN